MAAPSVTIDRILAAVPATTRGQPTQLSVDPKTQRIAYAVSCPPPCSLVASLAHMLLSV